MSGERTEKATPKRREDARKKGQVARRPDLASAVSFFAAVVTLRVTGGGAAATASRMFTRLGSCGEVAASLTPERVRVMLVESCGDLAMLALPVTAAVVAASAAANLAQGGLTFAPAAFAPKGERFNPAANLKKAFGGNNFLELSKGLLKLGAIAAVCYGLFAGEVTGASALIGTSPRETLAACGALAYGLTLRAGAVLALVAALDYGYGRYKHEQSLKMTKQEVKDEYKQQEGDPMMKGARRRAARAITQRRLASEVPRADVVVMNPTHFAVALRYDRERDAAPVVVAKGADFLALRIREIARRHNVAVVENPPLARGLYAAVDVGKVIPPDMFRAVAELLAYVYRLKERARG